MQPLKVPAPVPFDVECLYNVSRILLVAFAFAFVSRTSLSLGDSFPRSEENPFFTRSSSFQPGIISIAKKTCLRAALANVRICRTEKVALGWYAIAQDRVIRRGA